MHARCTIDTAINAKSKQMDKKLGDFVDKRIYVRRDLMEWVLQHQRKMEVREKKELKWEDALNEVLDKANKRIKL